MKFLLLLAVIAFALWLFKARRREPPPGAPRPGKPTPNAATPMLACAHCGLHLPQNDAVTDAAGRPFCSEAHRLAGPR